MCNRNITRGINIVLHRVIHGSHVNLFVVKLTVLRVCAHGELCFPSKIAAKSYLSPFNTGDARESAEHYNFRYSIITARPSF